MQDFRNFERDKILKNLFRTNRALFSLQKHLEYHTQLQKSIENVAVPNKRAADVRGSG